MKKLILLPILLCSLATFAQTDKGWRSVGGSGHLTLDFKNKTNSFDLSPELYWFVADDFALGTDFGFGFFTETTNDSNKSSGTNAFGTLGARYYFSDTEHKWRPYLFGNAGYEFIAEHQTVAGVKSNPSSSGFRGYAGVGLAWFFNEHAAFDMRLHAFDYTRNDIWFNPTFSIGIQAFFHHD